MQKVHYIGAGLIIMAGLLLLAPFRYAYTVDATGKIMPARQWVLQRNADGAVAGVLYDHARGMVERYTIAQPERGDAGDFALAPGMATYRHIGAGDTVGRFSSSAVAWRLSQLEGELAAARADLIAGEAGEKAEVVTAARHALALAEREAAEQRRLLERQRALLAAELVSPQELEAIETAAEVAALREQIARAELARVESGLRPEDLAALRARIAALEGEVAVLKERVGRFALTSPLSGRITPAFSMDTLLIVADTTARVVLLPVRAGERPMIKPGQRVDIAGPFPGGSAAGTIRHLDPAVKTIGGHEVVFATVSVDDGGGDWPDGAMVRCTIHCRDLTLWQHVRQTPRSITIN